MMSNSNQKPLTVGDFRSSLETAQDRFLAEVLAKALPSSWRSAADFLKRFPPLVLMQAMAEEPELRADVLHAATGCKRKTALGKAIASAAEDLEVALRVHDTTEEQVLRCVPLDARVRLLPRPAVWGFVVEPILANPPAAAALVTHLLERAFAQALVTAEQVVNAIGVADLVEVLPKAELTAVVNAVLGAPDKFTHQHLLDVLKPSILVEHVPPAMLWERVVVPLLAMRYGLMAVAEPEPSIEAAANNEDPGAEPVEDHELVEDNWADQATAPEGGPSPVVPTDEPSIHVSGQDTASISNPPRTTKDQVLGVLRETQLKLARVGHDAGLRELMIAALIELDGPGYADRVRELNLVTMRELGNMLCGELERSDAGRAEALRRILTGFPSATRVSGSPPSSPRNGPSPRG